MRLIAVFLVPRLVKGSGGIKTILNLARALEASGYACHISLEGEGCEKNARKQLAGLGYEFNSAGYGWETIPRADIVVATSWQSCRFVREARQNCRKVYLIQDFEPLFYPVGYSSLMAESSYQYGLTSITIGRWLQYTMLNKYRVPAYSLIFRADTKIYHPLDISKKPNSVCFIVQPDKPRRCSRLGIDALGIVKQCKQDVSVYIYGSYKSDVPQPWFECKHLGMLTAEECNHLYNTCSVGLCLSASNPSRVGFEMMAAGLPIVELHRPNCCYDFCHGGVVLSEASPESIAYNVLSLLDNDELRREMATAGVREALTRNTKTESDEFVEIIQSLLEGNNPEAESPPLSYTLPASTAPAAFFQNIPASISRRLRRPSNASLNALPRPVRAVLAWGARRFRSMTAD